MTYQINTIIFNKHYLAVKYSILYVLSNHHYIFIRYQFLWDNNFYPLLYFKNVAAISQDLKCLEIFGIEIEFLFRVINFYL